MTGISRDMGRQKGFKHSKETRKKLSQKASKPRLRARGKNSVHWKGGISKLSEIIRNCFKFRQWRSDVFTRDNFTCQECFEKGGVLNAHHRKELHIIVKENNIKTLEDALNCEELWNINNGITYCEKCHKKVHYKLT